MKKIIPTLICAGLAFSPAVKAEDICFVAYKGQNYKQSAECYVKELKKERSYNNLIGAGFSYTRIGQYKDALSYLKEAEKKVQNTSDYQSLCSYLSAIYSRLGDAEQELAYNMKFLNLSLKLNNQETIGTAYSNLGVYYKGQNQTQKALEYYEKALEYQKELEREATYVNMASAYVSLKEYEKAEKMLQKAINISEKSGNYNTLGVSKKALGGFYFGQNRYAEARQALDNALVIGRNTKNIDLQSHTMSILAMIDYDEGHLKESKEKAAEALRLAKQSGDGVILSDANAIWERVKDVK